MTTPSRPRAQWIADHQQQYLATDGKEGHIFNGAPTLLLTTKGYKSGNMTTTPLIYGKSGDSYVVVASKGGAPDHPLWYKNLAADPNVSIQVMAEHIQGKARTANASEKPALWEEMARIWPSYNDYQKNTSREIPVVIIEPAGRPS